MNIRHYLSKFVAVTAVVVMAATTCFGTVLSVPQYNQEKTQWCWDACCQMILKYYGYTYSQTEIAVWALGSNINEPNYLFDPPSSSTYKSCDQVLSHFGSIDSSGVSSYISWSSLDNEMANSRPVMIGVFWDSGGGHAIVLRGTSGSSSVYVNDPWYGQSVYTYDGVKRYRSAGTWGQTLEMTSGHANDYYTYYVSYYNLYSQYLSYYQSSGSYYYRAYVNLYYALACYYYMMYYYGDNNLANNYYYYYVAYAYYYYYYYYGYRSYALDYYYYYTAWSYYYAYLYTGNSYYYNMAIYYYNLYLS